MALSYTQLTIRGTRKLFVRLREHAIDVYDVDKSVDRREVEVETLRGDFKDDADGKNRGTKGKGCDIGYALAASSCEGANSVEARTVTALDAITAFAVPNPNFSSQSRRFFQAWMPVELPRRADHSAYFGLAKFYLSQSFQPSTGLTLNTYRTVVKAAFRCKMQYS